MTGQAFDFRRFADGTICQNRDGSLTIYCAVAGMEGCTFSIPKSCDRQVEFGEQVISFLCDAAERGEFIQRQPEPAAHG